MHHGSSARHKADDLSRYERLATEAEQAAESGAIQIRCPFRVPAGVQGPGCQARLPAPPPFSGRSLLPIKCVRKSWAASRHRMSRASSGWLCKKAMYPSCVNGQAQGGLQPAKAPAWRRGLKRFAVRRPPAELTYSSQSACSKKNRRYTSRCH